MATAVEVALVLMGFAPTVLEATPNIAQAINRKDMKSGEQFSRVERFKATSGQMYSPIGWELQSIHSGGAPDQSPTTKTKPSRNLLPISRASR